MTRNLLESHAEGWCPAPCRETKRAHQNQEGKTLPPSPFPSHPLPSTEVRPLGSLAVEVTDAEQLTGEGVSISTDPLVCAEGNGDVTWRTCAWGTRRGGEGEGDRGGGPGQ